MTKASPSKVLRPVKSRIGRGDENDWMWKNDDVESMDSTTCVKFDIQQGHLNNTTA